MPTLTPLLSLQPNDPKEHHIGKPVTGFRNPWPSYCETHGGLLDIVKVKYARDKPPFIPVPDRSELVPIRQVDFEMLSTNTDFKVTWIGHASFLLQTSTPSGATRGINILCDPVFSERTSPVSFLGPKRYTPTPCTLADLCDAVDIDLVLISHNHYDHADTETLKYVVSRRGGDVQFIAGLRNSRWLISNGIPSGQITELDWWDGLEIGVDGAGSVRITCTPTQHFSARGVFDKGSDLWCSYAIEEVASGNQTKPNSKKVYFSGDTGYRSVTKPDLTPTEEEEQFPHNPAFKLIGDLLGPFDLALLPIGLCTPRTFMSNVHVNSWDSIHIHKDVRSKKSIGMHWGTVRGGLSMHYEDVRTPPKHWRMAAEEAGLEWGKDVGLLDIGQTMVLE